MTAVMQTVAVTAGHIKDATIRLSDLKKIVVSISEIKISLDLDSQDPEGLSKHTVQNADFCLCLHDSRQNVHQLLELCVKFCPVSVQFFSLIQRLFFVCFRGDVFVFCVI